MKNGEAGADVVLLSSRKACFSRNRGNPALDVEAPREPREEHGIHLRIWLECCDMNATLSQRHRRNARSRADVEYRVLGADKLRQEHRSRISRIRRTCEEVIVGRNALAVSHYVKPNKTDLSGAPPPTQAK